MCKGLKVSVLEGAEYRPVIRNQVGIQVDALAGPYKEKRMLRQPQMLHRTHSSQHMGITAGISF